MNQDTANALIQRLGASAGVLVQSIDVVRGRALLVGFDAQAHRNASFLDDRILSSVSEGVWVGLRRLIDAARTIPVNPALHFIFHTGHVGSTLVSRLIDEAGSVLGLREPMTLRQVADAYDALGLAESLLSQEDFDVLLTTLLRVWGRGFPEAHTVVLKATSSAGRLAPLLLARQTAARAVYLNVGAEPYLATLLGGPNSVADLRGHAGERIRRLVRFGAREMPALHQLSPGKLAAMSWLAETWSQQNAREAGGERVLAIDFDALLGDVAGVMARIVRHLGVAHDAAYLAGIGQSPVLSRYAKGPEHAYSPQLRAQVLAQSRAQNGEEIRAGLTWLDGIAAANPSVARIVERFGSQS